MNILQELLFIAESATNSNADLLKEISTSAATQAMMYRGTRNQGEVVVFPIRKDRRPRDSSALETAIFNLEIERRFGIRNVRAQVAFATSNFVEAANYGSSVYVLFPRKDSKVLFNPDVPDSIYTLGHMGHILQQYKFPTECYDAVKNASHLEPEQLIASFLEPATPELKDIFNGPFSEQVSQLMSKYVLVSASDVPMSVKSVEYMILGESVYGLWAPYVRETTPAEGTVHTRALTLINGPQ